MSHDDVMGDVFSTGEHLSSASTISEIVGQYVDNATYDLEDSVARAKLFIQAARFLLVKRPASITSVGVSTKFNSTQIEKEIRRAQLFLASKSSSGMVRHGDVSNIRGW